MTNLILATKAAGATSSFSFLFVIILMFVVMYFTMIRPGKKQQNQRKEMLGGMKKGDNIVTIGGMHGVVDSINDAEGTVVIDADGIFLTFNRTAIRDVKPAAPIATEANDAKQVEVEDAKPVEKEATDASENDDTNQDK